MKSQDLCKPAVPIVYGLLILELANERGVRRETLLADLDIPSDLWNTADARLSLRQTSRLLYRAIQLTQDFALGYEIGLRSNLTTHGLITYGVMSFPSLRHGLDFGIRFLQLRLPNLSMRLVSEGEYSAVDVVETTPLGALRQPMFDLFLVGLHRIALQVLGGHPGHQVGIELWYDYAAPAYYGQYRERLPPMRFMMGVNQLRFPTQLIDRPLNTANTTTATLVQQQCERELAMLGFNEDFLAKVRAELHNWQVGYPDLNALAVKLCMSSRTLKRKLHEQGISFQHLLDDVRRQNSIRLLKDPTLSLEQVAQRIAYSDPANFTRAFRKWMGMTPSAFRARLVNSPDHSV